MGMWFYQSMAEDKVTAAFILAPVFFVFSSAYIQKPIRENLILVFLAGIGLTLTHPVILFFAIFVVACMFGIAFILKKVRWREATQMAIIFIGCFRRLHCSLLTP